MLSFSLHKDDSRNLYGQVVLIPPTLGVVASQRYLVPGGVGGCKCLTPIHTTEELLRLMLIESMVFNQDLIMEITMNLIEKGL
jgi:hypothetical protein